MQLCGTFETPWGNMVHVVCACGATVCTPATRKRVRCRRCQARAEMAELLARFVAAWRPPRAVDDPSVPPPCRLD